MRTILRFYQGQFGLLQTFLIGIVAARVAFFGATRLLTYAIPKFSSEGSLTLLSGFSVFILVLEVVHFSLTTLALWKAGTNNRTLGFWGWVALSVAALHVVDSLAATITDLFPSIPVPLVVTKMNNAQLNASLPKNLGDGLTLSRVDTKGGDIVYRFEVDWPKERFDPTDFETTLSLQFAEGQRYCRDMEGAIRGGVDLITFEYRNNGRIKRSILTRSACLRWLNENR